MTKTGKARPMLATVANATQQNPLAIAHGNRDRRINLPQLIAEYANDTPDKVFALVGDEEITFGAFQKRVMGWAATFQSLGITVGDHVLSLSEPDFDGYARWLGLAWLGATEVPVNPALCGSVLLHAVKSADAKLGIISANLLPALKELDGSETLLERILVLGDNSVHAPGFAVISEVDAFADSCLESDSLIDPQPHDIACIIFTSGTTGPAKAVLVPWGQMIAATYLEREDAENDDEWNQNSNSVYYAFFPAFHMAGRYALFLSIARGSKMVYRASFSVDEFWVDVDHYGVTHAQLLSPMMAFLMTKPESEADKTHSLIAVNGGPAGDVCDRFMRRFDVRVRTGYGMTEIGGPLGSAWLSPATPPTSCGIPVVGRPGYELRIVDDHDYSVSQGDTGELIVRASEPWTLNAGYYNMPEETAKAWRNGWFHTGDMMRIDENGEYHFVDRSKDCIRRRGENISSMEVEAYAILHPAILEAAALPHPSAYGAGEDEVKIACVLKPGAQLTEADFHQWLSERMPRHMVPSYIDFLPDLPRTPATQRIQKAVLKQRGNSDNIWIAPSISA